MAEGDFRQGKNFLMEEETILHVEMLVSEFLGRTWEVKITEDRTDLASHFCSIMSDGRYSVFTKLSEALTARDQFECEVKGLNIITEQSGVKTPSTIGIITFEHCSVLVLEAFQVVDREPRHWRDIGQTLATLHKVKSNYCGFDRHGYFGPLLQDNSPIEDWTTFYAERRILPLLKMAVDLGNFPLGKVPQVEKLLTKLPELSGPEVKPSLLHGDAQQNNFISTKEGTVIIDPAVYFGNPELDLAYIDYFQPVPDDLFMGYREVTPIDPGFEERRDLWRISGWLGCVVVDSSYLNRLITALRKYL